MEKLLLLLIVVLKISIGFNQTAQSDESKWREVRNGKSYYMGVKSSSVKNEKQVKSHIKFLIKGKRDQLSKVLLTQQNESPVVMAVNEVSDISIDPGHYTFKLYHKNMGLKEFEVDLKKAEDTTVELNIN